MSSEDVFTLRLIYFYAFSNNLRSVTLKCTYTRYIFFTKSYYIIYTCLFNYFPLQTNPGKKKCNFLCNAKTLLQLLYIVSNQGWKFNTFPLFRSNFKSDN